MVVPLELTAVIVDPNNFDRVQNYKDGMELCCKFLDANKIRRPIFLGTTRLKKGPGKYGYYRPETVHVNVEQTRVPTKTPGFAWTYTGWKADLTAAGIVAHEVGHHIEHVKELSYMLPSMPELPVSNYGWTNKREDFAEAIRLFILNPDLLRLAWPFHFIFLTRIVELKPVVTAFWRQVLVNAHPRYFEVAEKLVKKASIENHFDAWKHYKGTAGGIECAWCRKLVARLELAES